MLKNVIAGAVLLTGFAATAWPAVAAPRNDDCVNCEPSKRYDSESPAKIRQEMDRPRNPSPDYPAQGETAGNPERGGDAPARECSDCPPPKHYDKIEVVKTSRDVDQSRVINTDSVVHVRPKEKEYNKLVIHENEVRNVGVIQHNHRIIEKEIRYVKRKPVYRYPAYQVQTVIVPVVVQPARECGCPCTCSAPRYVYEQAYAYPQTRTVVQQVLVPVTGGGYGYGYGYR
jgi:hypothetical protein